MTAALEDLPTGVGIVLPFVPLALYVAGLAVRSAWEGRRPRRRALADVDGRRRDREISMCLRPHGCGVEVLPMDRRLRSGPGSVGASSSRPATAETPRDLPSCSGSAAVPPGAASPLPLEFLDARQRGWC